LEEIVYDAVRTKRKIYVPVIVLGEIFSGKSMEEESERKDFVNMIKEMEIVDIDSKVAVEYGRLKRENLAMGNDAWIGACCLVLEADLATLNKKDFEKIKELKLYS
jgi:predicted nucleic acid-binding protein